MAQSYAEIIHTRDVRRLREFIDPTKKWFPDDEQLSKILRTVSGRLNQAVIKCTFGIEQQAKARKNSEAVIEIRNFRRRFEAGLITV